MRRKIFEIAEQSDSGGDSYCWVERRSDGYYLIGSEFGEMCGPCKTVADAVCGSGFQYGMDYMTVACSVEPEELRSILEDSSFILDNVERFSINGAEPAEVTVDAIIDAYRRSRAARTH